jgi:hypothetical protein
MARRSSSLILVALVVLSLSVPAAVGRMAPIYKPLVGQKCNPKRHAPKGFRCVRPSVHGGWDLQRT